MPLQDRNIPVSYLQITCQTRSSGTDYKLQLLHPHRGLVLFLRRLAAYSEDMTAKLTLVPAAITYTKDPENGKRNKEGFERERLTVFCMSAGKRAVLPKGRQPTRLGEAHGVWDHVLITKTAVGLRAKTSSRRRDKPCEQTVQLMPARPRCSLSLSLSRSQFISPLAPPTYPFKLFKCPTLQTTSVMLSSFCNNL